MPVPVSNLFNTAGALRPTVKRHLKEDEEVIVDTFLDSEAVLSVVKNNLKKARDELRQARLDAAEQKKHAKKLVTDAENEAAKKRKTLRKVLAAQVPARVEWDKMQKRLYGRMKRKGYFQPDLFKGDQ